MKRRLVGRAHGMPPAVRYIQQVTGRQVEFGDRRPFRRRVADQRAASWPSVVGSNMRQCLRPASCNAKVSCSSQCSLNAGSESNWQTCWRRLALVVLRPAWLSVRGFVDQLDPRGRSRASRQCVIPQECDLLPLFDMDHRVLGQSGPCNLRRDQRASPHNSKPWAVKPLIL